MVARPAINQGAAKEAELASGLGAIVLVEDWRCWLCLGIVPLWLLARLLVI